MTSHIFIHEFPNFILLSLEKEKLREKNGKVNKNNRGDKLYLFLVYVPKIVTSRPIF